MVSLMFKDRRNKSLFKIRFQKDGRSQKLNPNDFYWSPWDNRKAEFLPEDSCFCRTATYYIRYHIGQDRLNKGTIGQRVCNCKLLTFVCFEFKGKIRSLETFSMSAFKSWHSHCTHTIIKIDDHSTRMTSGFTLTAYTVTECDRWMRRRKSDNKKLYQLYQRDWM